MKNRKITLNNFLAFLGILFLVFSMICLYKGAISFQAFLIYNLLFQSAWFIFLHISFKNSLNHIYYDLEELCSYLKLLQQKRYVSYLNNEKENVIYYSHEIKKIGEIVMETQKEFISNTKLPKKFREQMQEMLLEIEKLLQSDLAIY